MSILRITSTNNNQGQYGDRVVGFWFSDPPSYNLAFRHDITSNSNEGKDGITGITQGENSIRVIADDKAISLYINGRRRYSREIPPEERLMPSDLNFYAGDRHYNAAPAKILNLRFQYFEPPSPPDSIPLCQNYIGKSCYKHSIPYSPDPVQVRDKNLIGTVPESSLEWIISFTARFSNSFHKE